MKNVFAVDFTDEDNPSMPASAYERRRINTVLEEKMDAHADTMMENVERITRSWPHYIGMGAAALGCFVCMSIFDGLTEEADTIPAAAWWWLVPAAVCLAVLLLVGHSYRKHLSARMQTDDMVAQEQQAEDYYRLSRQELGVPETAVETDVLAYTYQVKKGKEKPIHIAGENYSAMNLEVFVEDGCLMLADAAVLYALPLSEVTAVRRIEGRTRVYCWNKDEQPKQEPYKAYRIWYDDEEDVFTVRAVYALEWGGAKLELLVPDYEWDLVLQPLTGLAVTSTEKAVTISFK